MGPEVERITVPVNYGDLSPEEQKEVWEYVRRRLVEFGLGLVPYEVGFGDIDADA